MAQIDWKQFNDNFQYYDKEIIKEVIDIFVEEYDERISTLQKNIEEKDLTNLAFNAHSFKSVISNYMAPIVLELTRSLEDMAKKNQEEKIPETFAELRVVSKDLLDELVEYLKVSQKR
jgi:HPt (histidine-containing phosphotransfer) domain-containing protein